MSPLSPPAPWPTPRAPAGSPGAPRARPAGRRRDQVSRAALDGAGAGSQQRVAALALVAHLPAEGGQLVAEPVGRLEVAGCAGGGTLPRQGVHVRGRVLARPSRGGV